MLEIIAGLIEAVVRIWDFATRHRPPSRASVARTIEAVNAANDRLSTRGMHTEPKQETAR